MDSVISACELSARIKPFYPGLDADMITRAYDFCQHAHKGQLRSSGAPYYTHPVAVAAILADMHLDPQRLSPRSCMMSLRIRRSH